MSNVTRSPLSTITNVFEDSSLKIQNSILEKKKISLEEATRSLFTEKTVEEFDPRILLPDEVSY